MAGRVGHEDEKVPEGTEAEQLLGRRLDPHTEGFGLVVRLNYSGVQSKQPVITAAEQLFVSSISEREPSQHKYYIFGVWSSQSMQKGLAPNFLTLRLINSLENVASRYQISGRDDLSFWNFSRLPVMWTTSLWVLGQRSILMATLWRLYGALRPERFPCM